MRVVILIDIMFVPVSVKGNCYPYRDILAGTYGMKWNKARRCYQAQMEIRGRKIENLEQFCNHFNLSMWVSGTPVNFMDDEIEEDDFIEQTDFDDSALGKVGGYQLPEAANAQGYKEIMVTEDFEAQWDVEEWFTGTRFQNPRPEQRQVIPEIVEAVNAGYKNIVVESPVGSGKVGYGDGSS